MRFLEQLEGRTLFASYTAATVTQLIAAINAANSTAEADTITLAAGMTFTLTAVDNTTNGATGLPTVAASGGGLTLDGNGATLERSAAQGTSAFRLLAVAPDASLTLKGLTLQGGLASRGGAIFSDGALTLDGVTIQNNTAQGAAGTRGGYYSGGGSASGGALYSSGALTMLGCTLRNNVAVGGRGADAGPGIRIDPGNTNNIAPGGPGGTGAGAGVYLAAGAASISNCTITGNTARGGEGGKAYSNPSRRGGDGGHGLGGGVYVAGGAAAALRNLTVTSNSAIGGRPGRGGVTGNGIGGGIYIHSAASVGLDGFTVKNTTKNTASTGSANIAGLYELIA